MRYETRKTSKGENKKYTNSKHAKIENGNVVEGFKVEFEASLPKFDSIDEMVQSAGGEDKFKDFVQDAIEQAILRAATTYDGGKTATEEDVRSKIDGILRDSTIASLMASTRRNAGAEAQAKLAEAQKLALAGDMDSLMALLGIKQ